MNPQHFGSDPADIRIRIRINPEIWIRIPGNFCLRLDALVEVCALWAQSNLFRMNKWMNEWMKTPVKDINWVWKEIDEWLQSRADASRVVGVDGRGVRPYSAVPPDRTEHRSTQVPAPAAAWPVSVSTRQFPVKVQRGPKTHILKTSSQFPWFLLTVKSAPLFKKYLLLIIYFLILIYWLTYSINQSIDRSIS